MSLFKGVQVALFLSTTSFALLTLPLVKFGDKAIEVQIDHQTQFVGSLREVSPPYLGGVALLSLSLGAATIGLSGWRSSQEQRQSLTKSLKTLKAELAKKDAQIQSLRLSDQRLNATGLTQFLSTTPAARSAPAQSASPRSTTTRSTSARSAGTPSNPARSASPAQPATAAVRAPAPAITPLQPRKTLQATQAIAHQQRAASPTVLQTRPHQGATQHHRASTHAFSVQAGYHSQAVHYGTPKTKQQRSVSQPVSLRH